jgi:ubiquinone/menaquinone biosynthesis C-methylase UbiE
MPDHQAIYARHAKRYDELVSREDHVHSILPALQRIRPLDGLDVVELGAGTGRLSCLMAPHVQSLCILDASVHMLRRAIAKFTSSGWHNWRAVAADHRDLPVGNSCADIVVSGWSVCYLATGAPAAWQADLARALQEMKRVVRSGGTILLLETLGTGHTEPQRVLDEYYAYLEGQGFASTWIRTDYRFTSLAEAEELTRFFFGDELAARVGERKWVILPECTGIWWQQL